MEDRLEQATKIAKEIQEQSLLAEVEEMIRDNKVTFAYNDKKYRVRLLNNKEKEELSLLRTKKYGQLLKDKDVLFERELIKLLKERGKDVDKIDEEIEKLANEELKLQKKCGESIAKNERKVILENYRKERDDVILKKNILEAQRTLLLEMSFENRLEEYTYKIITYLSLDELKDGVWQRMFNTLDEFNNYPDDKLITLAGQKSVLLQYL